MGKVEKNKGSSNLDRNGLNHILLHAIASYSRIKISLPY